MISLGRSLETTQNRQLIRPVITCLNYLRCITFFNLLILGLVICLFKKFSFFFWADLDPCIDVTCHYHCLCKAFGPHDARCVAEDSCPSYQEPVCSSNGTTYDNECLFRQEMCLLRLNFTVQHPGSCEG